MISPLTNSTQEERRNWKLEIGKLREAPFRVKYEIGEFAIITKPFVTVIALAYNDTVRLIERPLGDGIQGLVRRDGNPCPTLEGLVGQDIGPPGSTGRQSVPCLRPQCGRE